MSKRSCLFPDFVQFFVYNLKSIYQHFKKKRISRNKLFCSIWFTFKFPFFFRLGYILLYIFKFQEYFKFFFSCSNVVNFFLTHFSVLFTSQSIFTNTMKKKRISGKNYFAPYYSPQYFSFFFVWVIYFWYIVKFQEYFKFFFVCPKVFISFLTYFTFLLAPQSLFINTLKKKGFPEKIHFALYGLSSYISFFSVWA